ncbi:MAG: transposase [Simkaniaceae bacterium]|nr:transposase [Simkaniaceae bacterium]
MKDVSDRELERFLQENNAGKLFCGFSLLEKTPDYSYFSVLRSKIGTKRLAHLFREVNRQLKTRGLIANFFTFVDASSIISKVNLWNDRDKAIEKGLEKFWYGYKRNVFVCMKFGFISKVAVLPANITDSQALKHICPNQGLVFADKGYCDKSAQSIIRKNQCVSKAILKNNMKGKDLLKDAKISKMRMPFERVFSKQNKRARYKGVEKNQFQGFMQALAFNFKRLIVINDKKELVT